MSQAAAMGALGLDESQQQELAQWMEAQKGQMNLQEAISTQTSTCWDKCVTGSVASSFSSSEQSCLANCVERFIDTSNIIVKQAFKQK